MGTRGRLLALAALCALLGPTRIDAQIVVTRPDRGWLGISVDVRTVAEAGIVRSTATIAEVQPGSPAAEAGLRAGDVLVGVDGEPWERGFAHLGARLRPGDAVSLRVRREGRPLDFRLTAGRRAALPDVDPFVAFAIEADSVVERIVLAMDSLRIRLERTAAPLEALAATEAGGASALRRRVGPELEVPVPMILFRGSPIDSVERDAWIQRLRAEALAEVEPFRPLTLYRLGENRAAGAEVVELRPELAAYFEVEGGVLVVDAPQGTPAARAGLRAGDVITHVGGDPVASIRVLRLGLARHAPRPSVRLVRNGRTLDVLLGG